MKHYLNIIITLLMTACASAPKQEESVTAKIIYSITTNLNFSSNSQAVTAGIDLPNQSGHSIPLDFAPNSFPIAEYVHDDRHVTVFEKEVPAICYGGFASWWISDATEPESLDSSLSFYNLASMCLKSGEIVYIGNYKMLNDSTSSTNEYVDVYEVDQIIQDYFVSDFEAIDEYISEQKTSRKFKNIPYDLSSKQLKEIQKRMSKL